MLWILLAVLLALALLAALVWRFVFLPWSLGWGATPAERAAPLTGDEWCVPDATFRPTSAVRATRAVTIAAPPETVWPWLAQIGRGAGYYAVDRLDNGGKPSARHIVSWIAPPRVGDASAIGYLRAVTPGVELAWWMPPESMPGCQVRMGVTYRVTPTEGGSRLIARVNGDGRGWSWRPVLAFFVVVDFVMMRRQLRGLRDRAERFGARGADPERPETGARDQYQLYEYVGADGARAGVPGKEKAAHWHAVAQAELGDRMGAAA